MVWSIQDVGLLILFLSGILSGFYLGLFVGWFYTPGTPVPHGMVRKKLFDWLLELLGLQRVKKSNKESLSDMVMLDKGFLPVFPSPPVPPSALGVPELGRNVILSADYETHKVIEKPASQVQASDKKVSRINYEQE